METHDKLEFLLGQELYAAILKQPMPGKQPAPPLSMEANQKILQLAHQAAKLKMPPRPTTHDPESCTGESQDTASTPKKPTRSRASPAKKDTKAKSAAVAKDKPTKRKAKGKPSASSSSEASVEEPPAKKGKGKATPRKAKSASESASKGSKAKPAASKKESSTPVEPEKTAKPDYEMEPGSSEEQQEGDTIIAKAVQDTPPSEQGKKRKLSEPSDDTAFENATGLADSLLTWRKTDQKTLKRVKATTDPDR